MDGRDEYVRRVLEAYCRTPGTTGWVRRPDRMLAVQLYERGVAVSVIENALVLAAARRLFRSAPVDMPPLPPLGTIRSLAYFVPVIEEVLTLDAKPVYFEYLRSKVERAVGKVRAASGE